MRIGINGFGRIGRLVLRAIWGRENVEITHINDPLGDAKGAAHLVEYDSVHGRWNKAISNDQNNLSIEGQPISFSQESDFSSTSYLPTSPRPQLSANYKWGKNKWEKSAKSSKQFLFGR